MLRPRVAKSQTRLGDRTNPTKIGNMLTVVGKINIRALRDE